MDLVVYLSLACLHQHNWLLTQTFVFFNTILQGEAACCKLGNELILIETLSCRLVVEEDQLKLYHTVDNSRIYCGKEQQFIEVTEEVR